MAASPYVFISYSRQDYEFVQRLINDLQVAGIRVWIDQEGLQVGTPSWERAIRDAIRDADALVLIASPDSGMSRYVRGELYIAEMYQLPVYPVWAAGKQWVECVPLAMIETQYTDARGDRYGYALLELLKAIHSAPSTTVSPEVEPAPPDFTPRNPYKGLRPFTSTDKDDYFGRERLIDELVEALNDDRRFLAIVGPSGSGKSSVVMAGLIPRLQTLRGSDQWVYLEPVLPGPQPLESLAVVLADTLKLSTSTVLDDLSQSARGLHLLVRRIARHRDSRVVLLVDQFEELFTQTTDADKRDHFIDLLVTAATEPQGQTLVLITLRADFYDRPMNYAELGRLLEQRTKSVLPMSIEDLRDVIERPAALKDVRLEFQPGLVGDLLFEVRGQVGALPLLQFTLNQLVEQRHGQLLTQAAYQQMGGVKGALARHAEATYNGLPSDEHRTIARALFLRLIEPGATEQETTRRRAAQRELVTSDPLKTEILRQVASAFTDARLLTASEIAGTPRIEVSHEALIREWKRLADWLHEAREDIRLQQNISRDAQAWIQRGKRPDDLYRGLKLAETSNWAKRNMPSAEEMAFIEAAISSESQNIAQQEIARKTDRLLGISRQLHSTLELNSLLKHIISAATELTSTEAASILLIDPPTGELRYAIASHMKPYEMESMVVPMEGSIAGWVVTHDEARIVEDVQHNPDHFRGVDEAIQFQTHNLLAVPIRTPERVIGVLEASNKVNGERLNENDVTTLSLLAGQAAVAIENVRMFQQADFIAELAHELRTPLSALKASTTLLLRPNFPEDRREEIIRTMQGETERLIGLTTQFLDLARLETQRTRLDYSKFDLNDLIRECGDIFMPLANSRDVSLTTSDGELVIQADREKIKQALLKLIENAIKFNREGGSVQIQTWLDNGHVEVSVTDTGYGISEEDQKNLFQKFYRATYTEGIQGTGLGLVIAKRIIEAHEGRIWVESEAGVGSKFCFAIPLIY